MAENTKNYRALAEELHTVYRKLVDIVKIVEKTWQAIHRNMADMTQKLQKKNNRKMAEKTEDLNQVGKNLHENLRNCNNNLVCSYEESGIKKSFL